MHLSKRLILPLCLLLLVFQSGCNQVVPQESLPEPTELGVSHEFDETQTGTIAGTVAWHGDGPQAAPFRVFAVPTCEPDEIRERPNPRLPKVDPASGGVAGAVVYLRSVDLRKSRPWHHGEVRIEQRDRAIVIQQGGAESALGWVRQGDSVEIVNRDPVLHILRGRGAAFFSLPFHEANRTTLRRLPAKGVVELSSGSGHFWMDGHLFVDRHPYYCRTDSRGSFRLDKVPAGSYELVCWLPNWHVMGHERDAEFGLVTRIEYHPPVEQTAVVGVSAGATSSVSFGWSSNSFRK